MLFLRIAALLILATIHWPSLCLASGPDSADNQRLFSPEKQHAIDRSVDRAVRWLLSQQATDGSFPSRLSGQPGITALSSMAVLSAGVVPGRDAYGESLNSAIDFILDCQQSNGLFSLLEPFGGGLPGFQHNSPGHAAHYNHAVTGVFLGEVYGMCEGTRQQRVRNAIERGLAYSYEKQQLPKTHANENGGWRYHGRWRESDLSVTCWQVMFMRSAKNACFEVPEERVRRAVACVKSFFNEQEGAFVYRNVPGEQFRSRGIVGGGILVLSLAGEHHLPIAERAGDWLRRQSFTEYNAGVGPFHYGAFYASQAMYQLGGEYWSDFYPPLVDTLLKHQLDDGGWEIEQNLNGVAFGRCYSSSLAVLSLTTPYQLLPIYQR